MIRKNKYKSYTIYCDECQEYLDTIEDNMADAWAEARSKGWHCTRDSDFYTYDAIMHYCPECWEKIKEGYKCT